MENFYNLYNLSYNLNNEVITRISTENILSLKIFELEGN